MKLLRIVALTMLPIMSYAQTLSMISDLDRRHQNCLDKGQQMQSCSRLYYLQMDSVLNMAYNNLKLSLSSNDRLVLKKEEINWLKKRDKYFKNQVKEFQQKLKSGEWGPDMFMIVYDNDAEFIKERNIVLINRISKARDQQK